MVVQDRELATKHLADRRQLLAANLTRAIVDHLEQLKLDETTALRARSGENDRLARHATVFVTTVDSTGPRLPWSRSSTEVLPHKDFTDRVARGSRAELAGHRSADAADAYSDAQRHAADAPQAAYAELLLARSLATVAPSASRSAYLHLLALPLTVRDDDGVPFAFYAARTLDSDSSFRRHVRDFVRRRLPDVAVSRTLSPVACFAFADIDGAEGMRQRCADLEQAGVLLRDVTWRQTLRGTGRQGKVDWTVVNSGRWLIGRLADAEPNPTVIAVRLDSLIATFAPARSDSPALATTSDVRAEPLGRRLDGLGLIWPVSNVAMDHQSNLIAAFYASAVAIVLGVGLFGAYLLWRDVQRDIRLAQLRAQFVASVSHELKTPLTAIRIFAETLRDRTGIDPETRAEYLDTIARDSDRLTRLLQNVLDFSRIERGERTYRIVSQDLGTVVERALRTVRHPLEHQGFIVTFAVDRNLPPVPCDADAVEQAVLNLVSNAAKYAGDARRIDVRVTGARNEVMLTVRDYGTGIDEQYQSRLFERFYRTPTADNETISGTGLGLTLVAHFAAGHGGRVTMQSAPGKGSTFTVHLPSAAGALNPEAFAPALRPAPSVTTA